MDLTERKRRLRADGPDLLAEFGSPLYAFYESDLRENVRTIREALDEHYPDAELFFAVKANYNLGVLSVLRDAGCNAEAYARGELTATKRAGFSPDDVLLTGMNRSPEDIERALEWGVDYLLVDNATEAEKVAAAAARTGTRPNVLVRGNPAMEVPTYPAVATATRESKFGLDIESGRAMAVARQVAEADSLTLTGVQLHVGSQVKGVEPYAVAAKSMLDFAAEIRDELGVEIDVLDLGGGFPIPYDGEVPNSASIIERMTEAVGEACDEHDLSEPTLFLEPGRRLVGNAGALLATVGVLKETPHATFAVLDAGTNTVSSYWPYPIYALADDPPNREYHVAGPLCYSGDVLAEDVSLPELARGDAIAVDRVGAYSLGSASHTNAEPKPPVVLIDESGTPRVIRERETCEDVLGNDRIPDTRTFFSPPRTPAVNVATNQEQVELALQNCAARYAPDDRVTVFDVEPHADGTTVSVTGTVETDSLARGVREWTADLGVDDYDLAVCESMANERTVDEPIVAVRGEPDFDSEQVTQCLYGAGVTAFDECGGWTRVRVPDGYVGWMENDVLADATGPEPNAVLGEDVPPSGSGPALYAGTECRVESVEGDGGDEVAVTFRCGTSRRTSSEAVRKNPETPTGATIVETARAFSGTEYLWGGMTTDGIDCSGLVWISHRLHGVTLPRDADQQSEMGRPVERSALRAGDLLFFPGHVAISLGGEEYIHAYGGDEAVVENSFDPDDDRYIPDLDESFESARRVFTE